MDKKRFRIEMDTMGEVTVPGDRLYGAQTSRAVDIFPISGRGIGRQMIWALGVIKQAAARVNHRLEKMNSEIAGAIEEAATEVVRGDFDDHFPVDVFQSGSGTSSNMNVNEVIANRGIQILGGEVGSKIPIHPNDHVNMGQSSNDVFPSAMHLAALFQIEQQLMPALEHLHGALDQKSKQFETITKIGRTHLQDAVPLRLGQEFSAFAAQVKNGMRHVTEASSFLRELPMGGTAVGTGLNTHPDFGRLVAKEIFEMTGIAVRETDNHFEAQSARDAAVRVSGALKSLAISLIKIADDIRLLGSGPRLGLGELRIPPLQPGSSIMPGKVNPVIAEALIQVGAQVIGNDAAIGIGGMQGYFQLNTMQPLIARNLLEQIQLLANGVAVFDGRLVKDLEPEHKKIQANMEKSLGLATLLAPHIGYDRAAEIAKQAEAEGKTILQVAREQGVVAQQLLNQLMATLK